MRESHIGVRLVDAMPDRCGDLELGLTPHGESDDGDPLAQRALALRKGFATLSRSKIQSRLIQGITPCDSDSLAATAITISRML